jgi:hypothetical protein
MTIIVTVRQNYRYSPPECTPRFYNDRLCVIVVQDSQFLLALGQLLAPSDERAILAALVVVKDGANAVGNHNLAAPMFERRCEFMV